MSYFLRIMIAISLLLLTGSAYTQGNEAVDKPNTPKKEITVVISDSGLGGLAVMDDLARKLSRSGHYQKVNLIFVNALFEAGKGYNALSDRKQKKAIFNDVLYGIQKHFHPDMILIACNTLSVLYQETPFVQESLIPVHGIVKSGVALISEALTENDQAVAIITGTETTISENSHKEALLLSGFKENRIITQSCPQLQGYIEQDPTGEDTEMLISFYIEEALTKLPNKHGPVYLSLNCSHFGYSEELWKKAFEYSDCDLAGILNPNMVMGNFLLPESTKKRFPSTEINLKVVSKVELLNKESMCKLFNDSSPELTNALNNYDIVQDLF